MPPEDKQHPTPLEALGIALEEQRWVVVAIGAGFIALCLAAYHG